MTKRTVLLTGATGYIGSHTWCTLLDSGYEVIGIDNLCNSNFKVIERIAHITQTKPCFIEADVRDPISLTSIFTKYRIDAVIHFAALKSVSESLLNPIDYYETNLNGLVTLTKLMSLQGLKRMVFSSSATVYGANEISPIKENSPLSTTNPYGQTKLVGEQFLHDVRFSDNSWRIATLRYFNPVGAHESGLIGEDPLGTPNNLMPFLAQVAAGKRELLYVYGGDYPTADGTGVRDYIHVMDLANGHVKALSSLFDGESSFLVNLGTGKGYSVLEMVSMYEKVSGRSIPYKIVARRSGDIAACYADVTLASKMLNWTSRRRLDEMCSDSWRWQQMNPNGFSDV